VAHRPQSVLVAPQSGASKAALVTPQSGASKAALVAPQSGASEAAKAAGAELRRVIIPIVRGVPASGVTSTATGAGAAPRKAILPVVRGVPASGVTSAAIAATHLPQGVPYASDTDPVRIVSVALSSNIVHPGDNVTGDVVTSSNAASVTARVSAFSVAVPKVAPGKFHLEMKLPSVPLPPGDTKLTITAVRTDGKSTTREIAITVVL
jgi:hypothetical protein